MTKFRSSLLAIPVSASLIAASAFMTAQAGGSKSIIDAMTAKGEYSTFLQAVDAAGLTDKLSKQGDYTVFAPTDDAFAALPEGKLESLLQPESKEELKDILSYHIVPERMTSADIGGKMLSTETLQGDKLDIHSAGRMTRIDEAALVMPDLKASNGVIHIIDRVLIPDAT